MLARAHPMSLHPMAALLPVAGASPSNPQLSLFDPGPVPPNTRPADLPQREREAAWTEEEVVRLHWGLLEELRHLQDPETPLDEKIETLNWVFTDPDKDRRPFSFVNCLKVVGCSPLSPVDAYVGLVDHVAVRDWIAANVPRWMRATVDRYPGWVRELIRSDPDHVARELLRDPQWLNEEIRRRAAPDLLQQRESTVMDMASRGLHAPQRSQPCHG